jgi:O-antigen ligase
MTKTRWIWEVSVLVALGLTTIYATIELENPWPALAIGSVLGFLLLVPNVGSAAIVGPVRLAKAFTWWQLLWFVMLMSSLVFRERTASEISQSPVDGWALFRIGCTLLVAAVLFCRLTFQKANWVPFLFSGSIGIFSCFGVISLLSAVWSVNPLWTLYRSVEFLTDVAVLAGIVATRESVEEYKTLVDWTWILLGLLAASAWAGAVVDPSDALFADPYIGSALPMRLVGVMPVVASNDLSQISAILALISLSRLWTDLHSQLRKNGYRLLFVASLITLVITQTRGAYAAFLIGFALLLVFSRRYLVLAIGGGVASGAVALMLAFTNIGTKVGQFLMRGQAVEQTGALSGRIELWQLSFRKILEQPLTGYGGFAGSRFVVMVMAKNRLGSNVLNVYIDAMLNVGVWGLLLLLWLVGLVGWQLFRSVYRSSATQSERSLATELSLAYSIVVISSMESGNITTHPMLSFLVVLGFAEFLRRRNKIYPVYQSAVSGATGMQLIR